MFKVSNSCVFPCDGSNELKTSFFPSSVDCPRKQTWRPRTGIVTKPQHLHHRLRGTLACPRSHDAHHRSGIRALALGVGQIEDGHSIRAHPRHPVLSGPRGHGISGLLVDILLEDLVRTVAVRPKEHAPAVAGPSRGPVIAIVER